MTSQDFNNISRLNEIMQSNEYFRRAVTVDSEYRSIENINKCAKTVELYAYLYKNIHFLNTLFTRHISYEQFDIIQNILGEMWYRDATVAQAVKKWINK